MLYNLLTTNFNFQDAKDTAKYLYLINDIATRWNSSYLAWSRLIYLKEWIKILFNTLSIDPDPNSKKDAKRLKEIMISDDEWDLLIDLKEILSLFAEATTELEGSKYITNSLRIRMLILQLVHWIIILMLMNKRMHLKMMKKIKIPHQILISMNQFLLLVYLMKLNQNYIQI